VNVRPAVLASLAIVLLAGACGKSTSSSAEPDTTGAAGVRAVVAIVGDSNVSLGGRWLVWDLTRGSGGLVTADHLDDNYVPVFVARSGAGIRAPDCAARATSCPTDDFWKHKLRATFARVHVDAVVTDLGINDAFAPGTADTAGYNDYAAKIDYFMRLMPPNIKVLWTNLPCDIEPTSLRTGCNEVDRALDSAPARWKNLRVLDWASEADHRASFMDSNVPSDLRVHYSDAGSRAWAAFVTRALDRDFPT